MRGLAHIAARVAESIIVAEFFGYLLHRLMHTGLIPWMSVSHMKHHMLLYGPLQKQRPSEKYLDATTGRSSHREYWAGMDCPERRDSSHLGCCPPLAESLFHRSSDLHRDDISVEFPDVQLSA